MSKPSSRVVHGLLRLQLIHLHSPKPSLSRAQSSYANFSARDPLSSAHHRASSFTGSSSSSVSVPTKFQLNRAFPTKPASFAPFPNVGLSQNPYFPRAANVPLGLRYFSNKSSPDYKNFAKRAFEKPANSVVSTFSKYREAIGLQIESFLRRNYLVLVGAGGVLVCALLWRIMFGLASTFVGISEGMAKYGFLALSSAIVAFA
ncbi:hypothetical protein CRG98_014704, partial [Punica granatum]